MERVTPARRWGMFAILMLAGIAINISQLKIAAITTQVSSELGVSLTQAAWLTSVFTIAGIVLSLPGSQLMARIGPKRMLLVLMAALLLGNVIGALTSSFIVMLASRVIEGISCALVIPCGLSLISFWFSGEKSYGMATGIFATANPVANFIVMNVSLGMVSAAGSIKVMWWAVALLALVSLVLVKLYVVDGREEISLAVRQGRQMGETISFTDALRNPALVVLCVGMSFLSFVLLGLVTCFPQIFASYGLDAATANFYTSLNGLFGIPVSILAGTVIGRSGKPFQASLVGAVGTLLVALFVPHLLPGTYVLEALAAAVFPGGIVVTSFFMLAPELAKRPEYVPVSTGLLNTCYYVGIFLSTPVLTALSNDGTSWLVPSLVMAAASCVLIAAIVVSQRLSGRLDAVSSVVDAPTKTSDEPAGISPSTDGAPAKATSDFLS